jgi:hypothetical protein
MEWMIQGSIASTGKVFLFPKMPGLDLGLTQPPVHKVPEGLSLGVKQLEHEVDHSPLSNAEFKNEWSYTSAPCICLCGVDRDNFTFTLLYFGLDSYGLG